MKNTFLPLNSSFVSLPTKGKLVIFLFESTVKYECVHIKYTSSFSFFFFV
jgi:hypothetical protein